MNNRFKEHMNSGSDFWQVDEIDLQIFGN